MRKIEPEFITGMGYIGASPGVLYHMGGAGEQTVVTGNPALLEGVKGNRITSLTLHGKSTQGSTTGAQLLPFEVGEKREGFEVFKDGIAISGTRKKDIYAVGRSGMDNESSYDDFPLLASGEYYVYSDSASVNLIVVAFRNGINITLGSSMKGVAAKIKVMDGDKFRIFLRLEEAFNGKVKAMISKTQPTASNYEPYTGGKPSPSPEYPQEIKSAGQGGEIGVTVTGTNLLPFEVGQKGNGFEVFADGVQVDVDRKTDIYAVGQNNSNVESGYDEFALMTAGKYYIYSGTQDVYLYVVVWRKGKNVVLGYSVGTNAAQIEIMDGDKFRIFLRTAAAFKGKVKAMITRTPMNATSYEPYKPVQKLIVPTPNGLPGIPVSSGGNYTDEKGQQWVADEIDLARGERVKWIGEYEFTGKENVADFGLRPRVRIVSITMPDAYRDAGNHGYLKAVMSNKYKQDSFSNLTNNINLIARGQQNNICISIPVDIGIEDFKTDLSNQYASGRPVKVFYKLATPIRTPLPPETIAAYKTLRTYSPTTTVINYAGAGMSAGYRRK